MRRASGGIGDRGLVVGTSSSSVSRSSHPFITPRRFRTIAVVSSCFPLQSSCIIFSHHHISCLRSRRVCVRLHDEQEDLTRATLACARASDMPSSVHNTSQ